MIILSAHYKPLQPLDRRAVTHCRIELPSFVEGAQRPRISRFVRLESPVRRDIVFREFFHELYRRRFNWIQSVPMTEGRLQP